MNSIIPKSGASRIQILMALGMALKSAEAVPGDMNQLVNEDAPCFYWDSSSNEWREGENYSFSSRGSVSVDYQYNDEFKLDPRESYLYKVTILLTRLGESGSRRSILLLLPVRVPRLHGRCELGNAL